MSPRWCAVAGLVVIAVWLSGYLTHPGDDRDGQIVFIPMSAAPAGRPDPALGMVTIWKCEGSAKGLKVTGHVDADGEVLAVAVTPGEPQDVGRAVGSSFAVLSGAPQGAELGDFSVTLVWANSASGFAVVSPDSLAGGRSETQVGPSVTCPR